MKVTRPREEPTQAESVLALALVLLIVWFLIGFPAGWTISRSSLETELLMEGYELVWHGDEILEWGKGRWEVIDLRNRDLCVEEIQK